MSRPGPAFVVTRRSLSFAPVLLVGLTLLSCLGEITGPDGGIRQAAFALAPNFPSAFAVDGSGSVVPFTRVRVTADFGSENLATVVRDFPVDQPALELSLRIALPAGTTSAGIDLTLNMQYINAAGDTVFRAGPQVVRVVPDEGRAPVPIVPLDVAYVGTGSNAAFVTISPEGATVMAGTTTTFSAMAFDVNESVIAGTPFIFSSPDLTRVTVTPQGVATWLPVRGAARVIATLPTGAIADTTTFTVTLPPAQLEVVRGNGQGGLAGAALASPVVLRVTAADAVPVEGVTVTFAVPTGGGSVTPATAISDVDGLVSFAWTLGAADGVQTATASFAGLATPLTLTAVANPGTVGGLVFWTGAVDFDWSVAGNWSTGVVPSASDSVVIPAVATQPRLTAETTVGAVNVSAGTLWLNGHGLAVMRNFATTGPGVLVMQEEGSGLSVVGDALFAGGNESGLLTLGGLGVLGNFTQTGANSTASFQAGPDFAVTLSSNSPTVSFQNPGAGANDSRFGNLGWSGGGTLTQQSDVTISGAYIISTSTTATQLGVGGAQGRNLEFASFVSTGALTFDNVRVAVAQTDASQTVQLNNVTFRNLPGSATQVTVNAPGGVINLDNVDFQSTPTTGLYIAATDIDGADGDPLVVEVANATPTTPGGFTAVAGGAVINWPAVASRAWIGSLSADWNDAGNWSPGIVPGALDAVTIFPSGFNQPTLSSASTIGSLTISSGATLTLPAGASLTVTGDLASDGTVLVDGLAALVAAGTDRTVRGTMQRLEVNGSYTLAGNLSVANDIIIRGSLNPGGLQISTTDLTLLSAGVLVMQNAADLVTVSGDALFTGGSTANLLIAGTLQVGGRIYADASGAGLPPNSFAASFAHVTQLIGSGTIDVDIANPGIGLFNSHFANLDLSLFTGTMNVARANATYILGQLISRPTGPAPTVASSVDGQLNIGGVAVDGLVVNDVTLIVGEGVLEQFDNVRFTGFAAASNPLSIFNVGSATPFTMTGLIFETVPAGLGARYLTANDTDGATPNPLVVNVVGASPATPDGFIAATNGAVINWPPGAGVRLWTGTTDAVWTNAANWSGAIVPTTTDSVHIPAGTPNAPLVDVASEIRTLTLAPAASLILGSQLTVHGSVDVAPTAAITSSGGRLDLSSVTGGTISGALPQVIVTGGLFTLDGDVSINGNLEIYGNEFTPGVPVEGDVSIGNFTLTSTGGMFVGAQGTFTMMGTGVADFATYVNFFGNSTAGKLTNGTLRVGTEFYQDGTDSPNSFQASGAHVVEFAGASPQPRIFFSSPDASANAGCTASCFATLRAVKAPGQGGLRFQSDAKILGALQLQADSVSAAGFQIIAAGAPTFDTPVLRAGGLGFQGALTQNASTLAVDSLVAWGVGGPLSGIPGVRTVVTGSYTLDNVAYPAPLEVDGTLAIANNVPISGDLVVDGTVALSAVDAPALLTISGSLTVRGPASALISSGQPHVIDVTGNATFAGPNSTGNLVTGRLRVGSNFSAQATVSPLSFVADPAYVVEFTGTGTISVSDPAQSTFGSVEFTNSGFSRTLSTDIRATGVVSLLASSFTLASGAGAGAGNTRRIFADRVDAPAPGVSMFNVGLSARSFESGLNGSINFNNFDPSVVQLDLLEGGLQNSTLRNATFSTVPTGAGRYVRIVDATPTGGDGSPTLVVETPTPLFHGGWAEAVAPAIMTGWGPAPNFRWTGDASSTWTDPGNWADSIVPGSADSVYLTDGYFNPPQFPASMTLRALVSDVTSPLNLTGTVTITERLALPSVVTCDGGTIVLAGGVNPVLFSGDISCGLVRITSGTAVVDGRTTVGSDLQVEDNALLVLNRSTLVAPLFSTLGNAQVRMTEPRDSLIVQAGSFGGGSTNGLLTDGVLVVNANFTQNGTPESFAAGGNHTTVFAGLGNNQQAFFTNPGEGPGTSHFANVEMSKGEPGTHVQLDSRAFALGALRTGVGAPLQELFVPVTEPRNGSVLFQSHGADVDQIRFSNVIWSILDGAPVLRMDNISFFAPDSAATRLNMERSSDNVTLRGIDFGPLPEEGIYIRLVDTDGATGTFTVNVEGALPAVRDDRFILLVGGALLNWP